MLRNGRFFCPGAVGDLACIGIRVSPEVCHSIEEILDFSGRYSARDCVAYLDVAALSLVRRVVYANFPEEMLFADRLSPGSVIAGKAYFISQGEPIDVGELIDLIIGTAGVPPMSRTVAPGLAYTVGWAFEMLYTLFQVKKEPPMTRFLAEQLSTAHWFDISAARRDLAYHPEVSIKEGLERLRQSFDNVQQTGA